MIGIALSLHDSEKVTEFFELFKTPWEYFRPDEVYDVVIRDEGESDALDARLVIVIHRGEHSAFEESIKKLRKPVLLRTGDITFPVYSGVRNITGGSPLIIVEKTGECVGYRACAENRTVLYLGYDFFEEARYQLTNGQPPDYASFPTVDVHIANLRSWILEAGVPLVEIPPIANGSKFFACLTHDVDFAGIRNYMFDRTMTGFVYRALVKSVVQYLKGLYSLKMLARNWMAVAKMPLIFLGLLKDFWSTFRQYREIEAGARSTFFFVPFKSKPGRYGAGSAPSIRAVKYDVANLSTEITHLMAQGCEIGVHGIDSWTDVENGKEEIFRIQSLTRQCELGVRMHWLYFDTESPVKLEKVGYAFDSTCGYNERIGYKAGTSQVYMPPGAKYLLEIPLHVMDTSLFYPDRMNLNLSEGTTAIQSLIETATRFGGVLTFNWHDRSIAPERLWDGVYRCVLNELQRQGALFLTAGEIVRWFRKRRAVVFDQVYSDSSAMKVKLRGLDVSPADRMLLRIYTPSKRLTQGRPKASSITVCRDVLLADQKEVEVFL